MRANQLVLWKGISTISLLLPLLLVGLLTLSGCTTSPQTEDSGVTHLTLWQGVNPPPNRDVLQKLVDQFNQTHPQIQVESLYVGQADQQMPKILAAVVGNAAPDLLWFAPMITGQLVELEAVRSLDDWWNASPLKDQIDPALQETMQLENHFWSIPFGTNNVGIFYRPSLFAAAGIEQLPQTWEELRTVAQKLTIPERNQHGIVLPLGKGEWTVFTWLPFFWSAGGELGGEGAGGGDGIRDSGEQGKVVVEQVGAIAALQFWRDLLDDGSATLSAPERGYEVDGFLAGRVAMQLTGPWTLGQLGATGVDFGVFPIPKQARRATSTGGENLFLLKSTPERERAAEVFAEYVLSEAFQTQWALGTGYLPVNLRSRQSPAYQEFMQQQPAVSVFLQQASVGRSRPIFSGYSRISEQIGRSIEAVLLGKRTPAAALAEAQQRLDLVFAE